VKTPSLFTFLLELLLYCFKEPYTGIVTSLVLCFPFAFSRDTLAYSLMVVVLPFQLQQRPSGLFINGCCFTFSLAAEILWLINY
jgi:hypothetical protein